MSALELHIPNDRTAVPRYKIGNRFYESSFLEPAIELLSDTVILIYPEVFTSKPILVRTTTNRWLILDTFQNDLKVEGSSPYLTISEAVPVAMTEMKIPRVILGEVRAALLPDFNENQKQLIRDAIDTRSRLPPIASVNEGPYRASERGASQPGEFRLPIVGGSPGRVLTPPQTIRTGQYQIPIVGGYSNRVLTPPQSPRRNLSPRRDQPSEADELPKLSYETLVKQLYGLPVTLPQSLVVNGLRLEFIPFSQLNTIQIDRYIVEPLLQPWAGPPSTQNRIITIFATNGITYLVKALYNQSTNKIFQPI